MAYFIQTDANHGHVGIWDIGKTTARRLGKFASPPPLVRAQKNRSPLDVLKANWPGYTFTPLDIPPGKIYSRMARPLSPHIRDYPGLDPNYRKNLSIIAIAADQLGSLKISLEQICRTIHPMSSNMKAYGHETRSLLIIAAPEVEAQWKGILQANGKKSFGTPDYFKLKAAMRLDEYEIRFPFYPWLAPFSPFKSWSTQTTKSLVWYDAYNHVKHDREKEFGRASLLNAFNAISACAVLVYAQFGFRGFAQREDLQRFFSLSKSPQWKPSEVYSPPYSGGNNFQAIPYPF